MLTLYMMTEVAATMTESTVALAAVTAVCKPRYQGWKHTLRILLFSSCLTVIILLLNTQALFSYITPIIAMSFIILISSGNTSLGSLMTRCSFCVFSYIVIQVLDYIILVLYGLVLQIPESVFEVMMEPSWIRIAYILTAKFCDIIVYFAFRSSLRKIETLTGKLQIGFFVLSLVSYVSMQFLFSTIVSVDLAVMQTAVVFSWVFLISFVIAALALFSSRAKSEKEKQTLLLLESENEWMTENYRQLHAAQQENARQFHDFKHHLMTIQSLDSSQKGKELSEYVNSLLEGTYQSAVMCHSGNDIIDAILCRKAAQALEKQIDFHFTANFHIAGKINPIDICGILANQIDNAFDACMLIPNTAARQITVNISQREGFAFFRVENTTLKNPFLDNPDLRSTKTDTASPHGLGLLSIRTLVEKYNGSLHQEYKDGRFISVASFCFEPLDT